MNVTATATSLDPQSATGSPETFTDTSTAIICTVNGGSIQLIGVGQCTLTFSDSGSPNYVTATASMHLSVLSIGPTKIAMSFGSPSVSGSGVTNKTLTLSLQTPSGDSTVSNGTMVVNLTQDGNGKVLFANANGMAAITTTATFGNGVGTLKVYFGDTTVQTVSVTASSGKLAPATSAVVVVAGLLSAVSVTTRASTTASFTANDATLPVLQDQHGSAVSFDGANGTDSVEYR